MMDNRIVVQDKKFYQTLFSLQTTVLCEPNIDGDGGIPAGCQCDKDNVIWIADMRLGILTMDQSGNFKQVLSKCCPILQWESK